MIEIKKAVKYLKDGGLEITPTTLRNWCINYGIGKKIGGKYFTTIKILDTILNGEFLFEENKK